MEYVIAELIWEHKKDSSWHGLEDAIKAANRDRLAQLRNNGATPALTGRRADKADATKPAKVSLKSTIDRRKLQEIAERKPNLPLSQHELELLDTYFIRHGGPGLAEIPVFRRSEDLFQVFNKAHRVSFFVGARFVEALQSEMIARWDVTALNTLRERLPGEVDTESFVVATRDVGVKLGKKEWERLCALASGNVLASIGSPIACAGAEREMAGMWGIPAYRPAAERPPVCFAHGNRDFDSAFVRDPADVPGMKNDEGALIVNDEVYVSRRDGAEFGVVVGQRTGHESATFMIAGISGPGTLAAADFFASGQINVALPPYTRKANQPIAVAVIRTEIGRTDAPAARRIDKRSVENTTMAARPMVFEHIANEWVVTNEPG